MVGEFFWCGNSKATRFESNRCAVLHDKRNHECISFQRVSLRRKNQVVALTSESAQSTGMTQDIHAGAETQPSTWTEPAQFTGSPSNDPIGGSVYETVGSTPRQVMNKATGNSTSCSFFGLLHRKESNTNFWAKCGSRKVTDLRSGKCSNMNTNRGNEFV